MTQADCRHDSKGCPDSQSRTVTPLLLHYLSFHTSALKEDGRSGRPPSRTEGCHERPLRGGRTSARLSSPAHWELEEKVPERSVGSEGQKLACREREGRCGNAMGK